jgi:hypothetical protein
MLSSNRNSLQSLMRLLYKPETSYVLLPGNMLALNVIKALP